MKNFDKQVQELKELALERKLEVKLELETKDFTLTSTYDVVDTETGDVYEFSVYDSKYLFSGDDSKRRFEENFILKKLYFEMLSYEDKLKSLQLISNYFNLEDFDKKEENLFSNKLQKEQTSTETFDEMQYYVFFERKQTTIIFDFLIKLKRQQNNYYKLDCSIDVYEKIINIGEDSVDDKYFFTTIEQAEFDNLPDSLNFFNSLYEKSSLEFNKILSEEIKKATQEEQQKKQEQGEGEGEDSGQGGDGGQESLQDLINDILNSNPSGTDGQSKNPKDSIDLEDFMNEVQKGNIDNSDFTEQYNNKELQEKMKDLKPQEGQGDDSGQDGEGGQGGDGGQEKMTKKQTLQDADTSKSVAQSVAKFLDTSIEDLKRRFPTEKSATIFFMGQSNKELDEISNSLDLPDNLTFRELSLTLSQKLINDLKNT
jgi:hypothetical protein